MRVLLVDLPDDLAAAVSTAIGARHQVSVLADPRDEGRCVAATGVDVVVHDVRPHGADALSSIERATRGAWNLLHHTAPARYVQLSTMRLFAEYDPGWAVTEAWMPRPTPDPESLVPYLAEVTARELARALPVRCVSLRLDDPAPGDGLAPAAVSAAVAAIVRAVDGELPPATTASGEDAARIGWRPVHVPVRNADDSGAMPPRWPAEPGPLTGLPVPERIAIFGAGGPLAAAAVEAFGDRYRLLLTDTRPLSWFAAAPAQSPGAPRPKPASAPHAERVVDVTDLDAVRSVAAEVDCLINCAVVRTEPTGAFRVNVLGAYVTMRAAAEAGLTRVVHTGPALVLSPHPYGHEDDRLVGPDTPPRAGAHVYFLTKLLALHICRVFAEAYRIACPVLHYVQFVNPAVARDEQAYPFAVSWSDGGRSIVAAATVPSLPQPAPVVHVLARSPHGRYDATSGWKLLGIQPLDRLDHFWYRNTTNKAGGHS